MTLRILGLAFVLAMIPGAAAAQEKVATVDGLELHSAFWPNLHHRLHADARDGKRRVDTADMSDVDRAAWEAAIAFYAADLAKRDLRTGRDMSEINDALSREGALPDDRILTPEPRRVLEGAAAVYRKQLWPRDDRANRAWIADVSAKWRTIAARVLPRLTAFYREPWYSTPVRVDIVNVGAARGGYTWTRPRVHTVIDGADATYQGWLGVEMLLHEASHGLVDTLTASAEKHAKAAGKKDAGLLWHAAQFYVVGELIRSTLSTDGIIFTSYLYSTGLFDRAWKRYRPGVESALSAFLDGRMAVDEAIRQLVQVALD